MKKVLLLILASLTTYLFNAQITIGQPLEPCNVIIPIGGGTPNYPTPSWEYGSGIIHIGTPCPAKVGIGVSNPETTLDVAGTAHFTNNIAIGMSNLSDYKLSIEQNHLYKNGMLLNLGHVNSQAYGIKISTKSMNTKTIAITDADDKETFLVKGNGNLWATNIKVRSQSDFPDYVFNGNYEMLSIEELENFIKENKHLPNMPTAEEVEKDGIDVGEINTLLVEKVEELTLYLIAQNDIQKQQEEKILQLMKEIELLKK